MLSSTKVKSVLRKERLALQFFKANSISNQYSTNEIKPSPIEYTIIPLKEEHIAEATEVLTKSFCTNDPLCLAAGIKEKDFKPFAQQVVKKAAFAKDLSLVALNKQGKMIGCVICEDAADSFIPEEKLSSKLDPVISYFEELGKPYFKQVKPKKGELVHGWFTAVLPTVNNQKIGSTLNKKMISLLIKNKYKAIYLEITNPRNQNYLTNKHYEYNVIKFNSFKTLSGEKPFKNTFGQARLVVMDLRPENELNAPNPLMPLPEVNYRSKI